MRLIDADKLEAYGTTVPKECNAEDYLSGARDVLEHIDAMPTVEAIPIEWIENFIDDIGDLEEEMTMRAVYSLLINEWRKEESESILRIFQNKHNNKISEPDNLPRGCMYCRQFNGRGCNLTGVQFWSEMNVAVRPKGCPLDTNC